jgi:small conductance mechanosensitive channel
VKSEGYWAVRAELLEKVKASFDENGVWIPFPQRDVRIVSGKAA